MSWVQFTLIEICFCKFDKKGVAFIYNRKISTFGTFQFQQTQFFCIASKFPEFRDQKNLQCKIICNLIFQAYESGFLVNDMHSDSVTQEGYWRNVYFCFKTWKYMFTHCFHYQIYIRVKWYTVIWITFSVKTLNLILMGLHTGSAREKYPSLLST